MCILHWFDYSNVVMKKIKWRRSGGKKMGRSEEKKVDLRKVLKRPTKIMHKEYHVWTIGINNNYLFRGMME